MALPSLSLSLQLLLLFSSALITSFPQHSLASRVGRAMLSSSEKDEKQPEKEAAAPAGTPNVQNPSPQLPNLNFPKFGIPPLPQFGNGNGNLPNLNLPPVSLPKPQTGNGIGGANLPKVNLPPVSLPKSQQIPASVPPLPSVSLPKPSGVLPPLPSIPGGFQIPSIPFLNPPPPPTQHSTP